MSAKPPSRATLKKYGLSAAQWLAILESQGGVCAICRKVPASGHWVTDHQHVPGFKKLALRSPYVRGIVCSFCNSHVVGRFVTLAKARNVVAYLEAYEARKRKVIP